MTKQHKDIISFLRSFGLTKYFILLLYVTFLDPLSRFLHTSSYPTQKRQYASVIAFALPKHRRVSEELDLWGH
jgi:hypothetical protein